MTYLSSLKNSKHIKIKLKVKLKSLAMNNEQDFPVSKYAEEAFLKRLKQSSGTCPVRQKIKIAGNSEKQSGKFDFQFKEPRFRGPSQWTKGERERQPASHSGQISFGIRKTRKSEDKYNALESTAPKEESTPIKLSSYREYRTNKYPGPAEKPNTYGKFHLNLPLSECPTVEKQNLIDPTSVLVEQNEKLAKKVGQLETLCQNISHKLGFFKAKYTQDITRLQKQKEDEMKETIYLQKLVYYYKSFAKRLNKQLIDNGIQDSAIITTSVIDTEEAEINENFDQ